MIEIDAESWDQGVRDGARGVASPVWALGPSRGPGRCSWSYNSGRIEGKAFRDGFEVSMQVAMVATGKTAEQLRAESGD